MARGQAQAADKQLGTTNAAAAGYGANAAPIGANLNTQANNLINSPGYDPATLAAITNAGMGSVNATYGSAKDAIARKSATSGNPASLGALEDSLARDNATAAGNEAGNIQIQNAAFKAQQQAQGQQILSSLYGTDVGAQTSLYGMGPSTLNARAAGPGWAQGFSSVLGSITNAGSAAAAAAKCWVAAELYGGWYTPKTVAIRKFIFRTWYMKPFAMLYERIGERWAEAIRRSPVLRSNTQRLFDLFLTYASN